MTTNNLRIEMFGNMRAVIDSGTEVITRFRTKRGAILLAYLALKPGTERSRDTLCEMLWPEQDPMLQRSRLRYELSTLRSALGTDVFLTDGTTSVAIHPKVSSDVADFEDTLRTALRTTTAEHRISPLRKAIMLYQGDLLPGLFLPEGCPPEYDWIALERYQLRLKCFDALTRLITDLEVLGIREEAIHFRSEQSRRFPDWVEATSLQAPKTAIDGPEHPFLIALEPTLPVSSARFWGHEEDIVAIRQWANQNSLPTTRIYTLTGLGGVGKTRLAMEAVAGRFAVAIVPLAGIFDAVHLFQAIHQALHLPTKTSLSIRNQVLESLRVRGRFLLLLDNFEQIAATGSATVVELLTECPELCCLITSRRPLKVVGEQEHTIAPLPDNVALSLFLDRARAVRPDFASTSSGLGAAREAVHLLEGIPLSIELAAARAIVLSPAQLRDQLAAHLRFLIRVRPGMEPRHQSIRATLEWSVGLLSDAAKHTLAQLSIFRTSASFATVRAVCGDGSPPLLDSLEELRLHSLLKVIVDDEEKEARYDLLAVIRAFAAEQLPTEERLAASTRHAVYWVEEAQRVRKIFTSGKLDEARDRLLPDIDNIRAAVEDCVTAGDGERIYQVLDGLAASLFEMGFWEDVTRFLQYAEPIAESFPEKAARLLGMRGALARRQGDEETARIAWERQLEIIRRLSVPDRLIDVLIDLVGQAIDNGNYYRARILLTEAQQRAVSENSTRHLLPVYVLTARLLFAEGSMVEALPSADTAITFLRQEAPNPSRILYVIIHLLPLYRHLDRDKVCKNLLNEGFKLAVEGNYIFLIARMSDELALFCDSNGHWYAALLAYHIAQAIHSELHSRLHKQSDDDYREFRNRIAGNREVNAMSLLQQCDDLSWRAAVERLSVILPDTLK